MRNKMNTEWFDTTDIKNWFKTMKKYKISVGIQSVHTPVENLNDIFNFRMYINKYKKEIGKDKIDFGTNNIEFIKFDIKNDLNDNITFYFDAESKKDYVEKTFNKNYNYNGDIEKIDVKNINFDKPKNKRYITKVIMKKQDLIISNPPYNDGLDLKILNSLIDNKLANKIIFVHPATFLFNKNEFFKNINKLEQVILFWGNGIFEGVKVRQAYAITIWDLNKTNSTVHVIDKAFTCNKKVYGDVEKIEYDCDGKDITIHAKVQNEANQLFTQFIKRESIFDHRVYIEDDAKKTDFGVKYPTMTGNIDPNGYFKEDFFTLFTNDKKAQKRMHVGKDVKLTDYLMSKKGATYRRDYPLWFFATDSEAENFITYGETKIVRFLLSLVKFNTNLIAGRPMRIIPWMDFTKTWTDEKLIKEFGISKELWDYIDKFIPDYYPNYRNIARGNI